MSGGGGRLFEALPDEVLNHVLSFLPSREAVQASLLARRWRHLWRSTPAVRVRGRGDDFRFFVTFLIVHRNAAPLHSFEIHADLLIPPDHPYMRDPDFNRDWRGQVDHHVDLWVTHALSAKCRARSLVVRLKDARVPWRPRSALTFASPHLTMAHLDAVYLVNGLLDFSCCPALRSLALVRRRLDGALVSPSLERLVLAECHCESDDLYFDPDEHGPGVSIGISTPRLRCLEISEYYEKEQFLEIMPWLTEDSIRYTSIERIYSS